MHDLNPIAISWPEDEIEFSVCTLVSRKKEYEQMLQSFAASGFNATNSEFLYLDNSLENRFDGYNGINLFLHKAKGKYIIICHQDILLEHDDIGTLRILLAELDLKDQRWGICGNAGGAGPNHIVYHISYPENLFMSKGKFPVKVSSLDENFLIVKRDAHLSTSGDLDGFHLYATDLCLHAELNGFSAYAIAFNLTHKSRGNRNEDFFKARKRLINKYDRFFRSRWIQSNSTVFHLSGTFLGRLLGNPISLFFSRMVNGYKKRHL